MSSRMAQKPSGLSRRAGLLMTLVVVASCADGASREQADPAEQPAGEDGTVSEDVSVAGDQDEGTEPEPDPEPSEDPEPELTIRDVDFAALEWREAVAGEYLTPAEGHETFEVTIAEQIAFADVTGDGHEEALVGLEITEQQWFEQIYYIWTWDAEAETARQVESPVARMARCGDTIFDVTATDGAFIVSEALRFQDDTTLDCASDGPVRVERHITLEAGWPVLTGGLQGDGGICPQRLGTDDLWPVEEYPLLPGPFDGMSPLVEPQPVSFAEVDVWNHLWLYRENWMLAHVAFANPAEGPPVTGGDYTPCAWIFLEEDTRPIPHDPYLPEG